MVEQEPPKIVFPCENYPVKIMGESGEEFHAFVHAVVEKHAPNFDRNNVQVRASSKGTFQSITVWITATGEVQLQEMHQELVASSLVKMVL